ncbi:hypothetical protein COEREDRAFT_79044 [Coemansia reversa NRRL 1564]|uniref:BRCT domain-containing protein n=1 Tax=Coemansia reversa (strain ATCC 12441 / NRRL 1564) TaxID=763665 RepID=A0A2G5BL88_COERN|nr:hypothetical protein COEREDRAFT_79044 [Coemansia reversa NRRL 1564]|eukprot:PIA19770.1 hypothetical protein COEREDRAFT_79044 [Coemansia reversa NRRL 1564]
MKIFDGYRAWFAPNVPAAHINTWLADGGINIRDAHKNIIQYYFSNVSDDEQTMELVRGQNKVVYRSSWITDSSLSRTRLPLGSYALLQQSKRPESPMLTRRPHAVVSDRRGTPTKRASISYYQMPTNYSRTPESMLVSSGNVSASLRRQQRPKSMAAGIEYYSPYGHHESKHRDNFSETQSIRSRCSSRHSNASSIVSSYGRRQHVVTRFVINADRQTRNAILADVSDFTPNDNGFVAYKIPKLAF